MSIAGSAPFLYIGFLARDYDAVYLQNIGGPKLSRFSQFLLEPRMFFHKFQSVLALVDFVLMQTQKFFREYLHGDLTTNVLSLESFVLYGTVIHKLNVFTVEI